MTSLRFAARFAVPLALVAGQLVHAAPKYSITRLASLDDAAPSNSLVLDASGNLYGTTHTGGDFGFGSIYRLDANNVLTTLASFSGANGSHPSAGVVDSMGRLYGTTYFGGSGFDGTATSGIGTIFRFDPVDGSLTTLVSFSGSNGSHPAYRLTVDSNGLIYGAASRGGALFDGSLYSGGGTIFRLNPNTNAFTTLASFNRTNGIGPHGDLTFDLNGQIYGTTLTDAINGAGKVFRLNPSTGAITALASFAFGVPTIGASPQAGVTMAADGHFYGTTGIGGAGGASGVHTHGTLYKVDSVSGVLSTLISFDGTNGAGPVARLIADPLGSLLYGTTNSAGDFGAGTFFQFDPATGVLTTLFSFGDGDIHGSSNLIVDSQGNFYGTDSFGGKFGFGGVFKIAPVPEPSGIALALLGSCVLWFRRGLCG